MNTARTPPVRAARGPRLRRWLIGLTAALVLLAIYMVAVDRIAERIGADVARTLHATPGVDDDKHRAPSR